jgi:hypothetical protein
MAFDRPENDDDPDVFTLFGYKALLHGLCFDDIHAA